VERYTIGGVAFLVKESLPELETDSVADAELRVLFETAGSHDETLTREDKLRSPIRRVGGPADLSGAIDPEGGVCWLPAGYDTPAERSWQLRQMAPIFSTVLGRLVLHASAVETDEGVIGFVGASRAGKSTLTRYLSDRGWSLVSDDLLPVRFTPRPSIPTPEGRRALVALYFLGRAASDKVSLDPLPAVTAMQRLIHNGFGEHDDERAGAFQFDSYHRLVESVPQFDLAVPDDLTALRRVAETIGGVAPGVN